MANPEHLKILKQGVEVWNRWRAENFDVRINLSEADLSRITFSKANLNETNLNGANLNGANLSGATFVRTTLREATLSKANLCKAILRETNFTGAIILDADISNADLSRAILREADFSKTILREADLTWADLTFTNLSKATITGVQLYGTARDDWMIDGIICDYMFWDLEGKKRTPQNRNFRPGEFEKLYKALPTVEYYFEHGFTPLDAVVMNQVVQAIDAQHPEFELKLDSFHSRGQPHAVFTVLHKEQTDMALQQITDSYERRLAALEGQQQQLMELFGQLAGNPQPQLISQCQQVVIAGRDYFERVDGHAQVSTGTQHHTSE